MKKRIFALLLAVWMLCALAGCGDDIETKPNNGDTTTTTTTTTQAEPTIAPLTLVEGEVPADCHWHVDTTAINTNETVVLKANVDLTDVCFLELGADVPTVEQTLRVLPSLVEGDHWAIETYVNDAVPNRGIACTDKDGKTYYYAIAWSGKDGSISLTELNIAPLSEEQLTAIETYLNATENNGFVSMNEYTCPEEASLSDILYGGGGIGVGSWEWSKEEQQDYLAAIGWEEFYISATRFARTDIEALILEKLGIPLAELDEDIDMRYIEKYDAYYHAHSDTQYQPVEILHGWLEGESGLYVVHYELGWMGDIGRVTLRPTEDGYQFVSNQESIN